MSGVETQSAFCFNCGQSVRGDASFCSRCGEAQQLSEDHGEPTLEMAAPRTAWSESAPPPVAPSGMGTNGAPSDDLSEQVRHSVGRAGERLESVSPGGSELVGVLLSQVSAPGAVVALMATAAAVGVVAVMALILGVLPVGDASIMLFDHDKAKLLSEVMLQFGQLFGGFMTVRDGSSHFAVQTMPLLLVAVPVLTLVLVTRWQSTRVASLEPVGRLLWGGAAGLPLAGVLFIVATLSKTHTDGSTIQLAAGSTALLGLLWGGLGGLLGAYLGLRRDGLHTRLLPPVGNQLAAVFAAAARSLGAALLVAAIGMTVVVAVQSARGVGESGSGDRTRVGATAENSLFIIEHGVHGIALGTFAKFSSKNIDDSYGMPVPVTKSARVLRQDGYRLTDYGKALPAWLFIIGLIALVALPGFLALNAGFACARTARASTLGQRVAWGLVPAPIWAASMVALNSLANKTADFYIFGLGNGGSILGMSLLFTGVLGALGGALAGQSSKHKQELAT